MDPQMIGGAIQAAFASAGLFYVVPRVWSNTAYRTNEPDPDRLPRFARWRLYGWFTVVFIGLGVVGYHATGSLVGWVPDSWGGVDEDGDWMALRPALQGVGAFLFAGFSVERSHLISQMAALRPMENAFTTGMIAALMKPCYRDESGTAYRARLIREARLILKHPFGRREGPGERAEREKLLRWLED